MTTTEEMYKKCFIEKKKKKKKKERILIKVENGTVFHFVRYASFMLVLRDKSK